MAQAFKPTLTDAGLALLNEVMVGGTLRVTRAQVGSGRLPDGQPIEPLTALIDPFADAQIKGGEAVVNKAATIAVQYENKNQTEDRDICELGVWARSTNTPEVLYCYMTFGDKPDHVQAATTGKDLRAYDIPIRVDNLLLITVDIDVSATATMEDVQKILESTIPAVDMPEYILNAVYPVGSIYMSVNDVNPEFIFGGKWDAWGTGRVPVGVDPAQTEFNSVEKTGGSKTVTLTIGQIPNHTHAYRLLDNVPGGPQMGPLVAKNGTGHLDTTTASTGGSGAHSNLQPFITCYMWKRVA